MKKSRGKRSRRVWKQILKKKLFRGYRTIMKGAQSASPMRG